MSAKNERNYMNDINDLTINFLSVTITTYFCQIETSIECIHLTRNVVLMVKEYTV